MTQAVKQPLVLCRRWLEEENEMMDLVSGAEVPEAEIEVTPEMIAAGIKAAASPQHMRGFPVLIAHIYREMRRVELSRKEPTP